MKDFEHLVVPHARALGAYVPGKPLREAERESGTSCVKMASNENPFGPSPRAVEAMRRAAAQANYYPDNDASDLRAALAQRLQLDTRQVLVADGSTALLDIISRTVLAPGLNAITSERSFIVYPIATRAAGATLIEVPTRNNGFNLEAVAKAVNPQTRLVFLANPNNPTGTMLDAESVDALLAKLPDHVLVVLDEAYFDFAMEYARDKKIRYSNSLDLVRAGKNVVVLRTFSKGHGLAGIRVGYALGPEPLLHYFARMRAPFSVSAVSEAGALAALDDQEHIRRTIENNSAGLEYLYTQLDEMGVRYTRSAASFIFCELDTEAAEVARRIQESGVIVRPLGPWNIPNAMRVTVGTPEQNQRFIAAFRKALAPVAAR